MYLPSFHPLGTAPKTFFVGDVRQIHCKFSVASQADILFICSSSTKIPCATQRDAASMYLPSLCPVGVAPFFLLCYVSYIDCKFYVFESGCPLTQQMFSRRLKNLAQPNTTLPSAQRRRLVFGDVAQINGKVYICKSGLSSSDASSSTQTPCVQSNTTLFRCTCRTFA